MVLAPGDDVLLTGVEPAGGIERGAMRTVRLPVQVRSGGPEGVRRRDAARPRRRANPATPPQMSGCGEEVLEPVKQAKRSRVHHEGMQGRRTDLLALVHKDEHVRRIEQQLHQFLRGMLAKAAKAGHVRTDVPADELAAYCLHALAGASQAPSKAAATRLVDLTLAGLGPT